MMYAIELCSVGDCLTNQRGVAVWRVGAMLSLGAGGVGNRGLLTPAGISRSATSAQYGGGMISVFVASETRLLRHLLSEALGERFGIVVAATAPSASRALAVNEALHADVVIVSMQMPDAVPLVRALLQRGMRVVTLGFCNETPVAVVDDGTLDDVVAAIHGAMKGAFTDDSRSGAELDQLTPTERRVLHAVNEGWSNKEIARELGVAVPTVKNHVHSLLTKLGVRRRGEAAALLRRTRALPAIQPQTAALPATAPSAIRFTSASTR